MKSNSKRTDINLRENCAFSSFFYYSLGLEYFSYDSDTECSVGKPRAASLATLLTTTACVRAFEIR